MKSMPDSASRREAARIAAQKVYVEEAGFPQWPSSWDAVYEACEAYAAALAPEPSEPGNEWAKGYAAGKLAEQMVAQIPAAPSPAEIERVAWGAPSFTNDGYGRMVGEVYGECQDCEVTITFDRRGGSPRPRALFVCICGR